MSLSGERKKVVCIHSAAYSGSTFIGALISNNDESLHLGEIYAHFRPYRKHHLDYTCSCGNSDCQFLDPIKQNMLEINLYSNILAFYQKRYLVDSSKNLAWYFDRFKDSSGIDIYNIVIWKDLKSYCFSRYKRGDFKNSLVAWMQCYEDVVSTLDDYLAINLDEFQDDLDQNVVKLNNLLGTAAVPLTSDSNVRNHVFFGSSTFKSSQHSGQGVVSEPVIFSKEFEVLFDKELNLGSRRERVQAIEATLAGRNLSKLSCVGAQEQRGSFSFVVLKIKLKEWLKRMVFKCLGSSSLWERLRKIPRF